MIFWAAWPVSRILLIGTVRPEWKRLRDLVAEIHAHGDQVAVAGTFAKASHLRSTKVDAVHEVAVDLSGRRNGDPPPRFSPRWFVAAAFRYAIRIRLRFADTRTTVGIEASFDPWVRHEANAADMLIALDPVATYAVWRLQRRYPGTESWVGFDALRRIYRTVDTWTSARRSGLSRVSVEDVKDAFETIDADRSRPRYSMAKTTVAALVRRVRLSGAPELAAQIGTRALTWDVDPEVGALLELELTTNQIASLEPPERELGAVVAVVLTHCDSRLERGDLVHAVDLLIMALDALFNRELHASVENSQLVDEPEAFLAPLHQSAVFRAMTAGSAPTTRALRRTNAVGRVLAVSSGNFHFMQGIMADLAKETGVEVRTLEISGGVDQGYGRTSHWGLIHDSLIKMTGGELEELSAAASEELAWPDVVFVDWCDHAAVWAALRLPDEVRLVVRVHSIEAMSVHPYVLDWSRVDDVIFVGSHIRDFLVRAVPAIATVGNIHVVPNEMDLGRFAKPKRAGADRTVAMIGWGQHVKDPVWALEVLAALRAVDQRWRLMLVGHAFRERQTASGRRYVAEFEQRRNAGDVRDAVIEVGYTENLPDVIRDAGFVLSASRRESFGVGPVEAAASGAVPVIRNWPLYAAYNGAARVFPADWIVDTPSEAAKRILDHADPDRRAEAGEAAREFVLRAYDWPVVAPRYREILLGRGATLA